MHPIKTFCSSAIGATARTPLAAAIALLCLSLPAAAQSTATAPATASPAAPASAATSATTAAPAAGNAGAQAKDEPMARVEINGKTDYDPRRDDTASKTVLHAEEIMKYGDTNVYDVLKRAPGVTVIGNSIRMRGLGNGYTQIMVNGERPPPGFSMDALAPDQIERIEVIRAATAEHSMQAVAGSINIVLKKVVAKPQRDLRINTAYNEWNRNLFVLGTLADRKDNLSYYLNAMVARELNKMDNQTVEQFTAPGGVPQVRERRAQGDNNKVIAGIQPRLNWKLANDGQLNLNGFLQAQRAKADFDQATFNRTATFPLADYANRRGRTDYDSTFGGADLNWVAKLAGGKLDASVSLTRGLLTNIGRNVSFNNDGRAPLRRDNDAESRFYNYSTKGKYARTLFDGHSLATGWEASSQESRDTNLRVEGLTGGVLDRIDESFNPTVTKLAAFLQDEWNVTKEWSVYAGARWEGIRTESAGAGRLTTRSSNHVLTPVAQTLYKFPDKSGRQLRLALTRTFKAPTTQQLTARRYEADVNTRFTPDTGGNPDLKPELATGVDLTYEHFFAPGAVFSVGTSQRRISDYIRNKLAQDANGRWIVQPLNDGSAVVRTFDVDLKFPLKAIDKNALPFDFRATVNRNWSQVESVPGPKNKLDQQSPLSVVLGADYRGERITTGASFNFRRGGYVRISEQQSAVAQTRSELEAYLLYKVNPGVQARFTVNNMLGQDNLGQNRYADSSGVNENWTRGRAGARFNANLELKF